MKYDKDMYWWSYNSLNDTLEVGCYMDSEVIVIKDASKRNKGGVLDKLREAKEDYVELIDNDWEVIFNG